MAYRSWPAAAGAAVVVLAVVGGVVMGIAMTSGSSAGESADRHSTASPGTAPGSTGKNPGRGRSGTPMPLPQPVAPREQPQRPDARLGASIQSYEMLSPRRMQLRFTTGAPECYGRLDRAAVSETAERVTVTLLLQPPPAPGPRACPEIAVVDHTVVQLQDPLGARVVVDGGTQRPVRRGHLPR